MVLACGFFLLLKLPLLFAPAHWEELRDADAFLRVSEGLLPYVDYYWHYGPLGPLLYGVFLKFLPATLLSVRVLSLGVHLAAFGFVIGILRPSLKSPLQWIPASLLATLVLGSPNYSHNHFVAQTFLLASAYFWFRFLDGKKREGFLLASFGCVIATLFVRPILTGYLSTIFWGAAFAIQLRQKKVGSATLGKMVAILGIMASFAIAVYGRQVLHGFFPRPAAVYPPRGYPNLHHLLAPLGILRSDVSLVEVLKAFRTPFDTFFFYFHFFIWPTCLVCAYHYKKTPHIKKALYLCGLALASSVELLHYGYTEPDADPTTLARGAYFLVLTACSLFVATWPTRLSTREGKLGAAIVTAFSLFVAMPWLGAIYRLKVSPINPLDARFTTGIAMHPDQSSLFEALKFVDSLCGENDTLFFAGYFAGYGRLVKCKDILFKDDHLPDVGGPGVLIGKGDSLFTMDGALTVKEIVDKQFALHPPRAVIAPADSSFLPYCFQVGREKKLFGSGQWERIVCYR